MAARRFRSKIDAWLAILFVVAMLAQTAATISVLYSSRDTVAMLVMITVTIMLYVMVGSTLKMTYYEVGDSVLRIVSGPFRWNIPLEEIYSVEETRSPWSSPALSLDRLRIAWGNNKKILVSPADKKAFAKAIGQTIVKRGNR
jgi:uncharacterized membrane protein